MNTESCGPCNGHCNQGRQCPAHRPAEACTDINAEPYTAFEAWLWRVTDWWMTPRGGMLACIVSAAGVISLAVAIAAH